VPDVSQPIHLHPVATLAERVLLPGDPGRALALAQIVLGDDRKMFNHHRGLWGYTGTAADGAPLTIQSTGLGGASAAIVLEELAALGVRAAVRVGTGRAVTAGGSIALGELVAATAVLSDDGASRALGAPARQELHGPLAARLREAADHHGLLASTDLFYQPEGTMAAGAWAAAGALAVDLETAALAAVAARHGVAFGSLLAIVTVGDERLDDEAIVHAGEAVGRAGAAALAGG
jgi:uridine phosphorylase